MEKRDQNASPRSALPGRLSARPLNTKFVQQVSSDWPECEMHSARLLHCTVIQQLSGTMLPRLILSLVIFFFGCDVLRWMWYGRLDSPRIVLAIMNSMFLWWNWLFFKAAGRFYEVQVLGCRLFLELADVTATQMELTSFYFICVYQNRAV